MTFWIEDVPGHITTSPLSLLLGWGCALLLLPQFFFILCVLLFIFVVVLFFFEIYCIQIYMNVNRCVYIVVDRIYSIAIRGVRCQTHANGTPPYVTRIHIFTIWLGLLYCEYTYVYCFFSSSFFSFNFIINPTTTKKPLNEMKTRQSNRREKPHWENYCVAIPCKCVNIRPTASRHFIYK